MSFFDKLLLLFFGNEAPGSKKKKEVKRIAKEISQNKYRKFYRIKTEEITPVAGAFFYDIYKSIFLLQNYMKNIRKSTVIKEFIVEAFLSKELEEVYKRLSPESIAEQAKTLNPNDVSQHIQADLNVFLSVLKDKTQIIDRYYNLILSFTELTAFDFFSLLKKMDPRIREGDFSYQPQFRSVDGKQLIEKIKDFLDIVPFEITTEEWNTIFEILKKYKTEKGIIDLNPWKKSVITLRDIHRSNILVLMVRYIEQNPKWQRKFHFTEEYLTEAYINAKKTEIQVCISKITNDKRINKRDALAKALFGYPDITRLQYYTNTNNEVFTKKNLEGFTHITALNYLKGFLADYYDILDLCDLFLIRGQWRTQELSRNISQGIHKVTNMSEQLTAFDATLADNGINGRKLKNQLNKYKVDKSQITNLKTTFGIVNNSAKEIIDTGIASLTLVGTYLKSLYDDYENNQSTLLVNWKEIEIASERPIAQRMKVCYQTIEDFMSLLQFFIDE